MVTITKETEALCQDLVRRLVPAVAPRRIILFGSRATGNMRTDSDVDLLLVVDRPDPREAIFDGHRALSGFATSVDLLACTPERFDALRAERMSFVSSILRDSRTIYEAE